jgi:hypothetical protein
VIGAAVKVARIATGDETGALALPPNPAAHPGRLGGRARAKSLTAEQRQEIAKKAAARRWKHGQE